jgi:hypothetical protein
MSGSGTGAERRTAQRYGCAGDAEVVLPGRGLRYAGKIGNLSVGGCFVETRCGLERGTAVEVWLNAQGQPLRLAANLMVRRTTGVGLRFLGMTERKAEQIRGLIAELAGEEREREGDDGETQVNAEPEMFSRHVHATEKRAGKLRRWLAGVVQAMGIGKRRR